MTLDITRTELGLLLTLDVLLVERNVTRAAQRLGISQPALSAQLSRLREIFGDQLLVPAGRGLEVTDRAQSIMGPLHRHLEELISLVRETQVFDPFTADRVFVIATTDYAQQTIVPEIIRSVHDAAPGVVLVFVPITAEGLIQKVQSGHISVVVASDSVIPDALRAFPLFTDRHVMVQRESHPRGTEAPGMDEYCALEHAGVSLDGQPHGMIDDHLQQHGRKRRLIAAVPSYAGLPILLQSSDLVVTVPRRVASHFMGRVEIFPLPFETPLLTYLVAWHERSHGDTGNKWLRDIIIRTLASK
ncbi:LysR family transcriptional regulator [Rhizobium gallicum]|nr:LysR family transcriptional regulator [Rhizobium gallicum]